MRTIERILRILRQRETPVTDPTFATYYSMLVSEVGSGAPTVEEARRDFESVRRVLDRAFIA
ncbi:hypothetical protein OO015_04030 [Thermomicrobium sp. 4228-Ro]|uniref:hypothetical protein n=1 Tax=Thermomicrobium sp. 4228-Ro TaxID=2993937 RepID=UPI002248C89A|nr:hypothetical protein [Thermomicrobium sp. 4228-Ro]MCX2726660.1 hypothetical protein [Thermomicrobium sp. 4228-Ro]